MSDILHFDAAQHFTADTGTPSPLQCDLSGSGIIFLYAQRCKLSSVRRMRIKYSEHLFCLTSIFRIYMISKVGRLKLLI